MRGIQDRILLPNFSIYKNRKEGTKMEEATRFLWEDLSVYDDLSTKLHFSRKDQKTFMNYIRELKNIATSCFNERKINRETFRRLFLIDSKFRIILLVLIDARDSFHSFDSIYQMVEKDAEQYYFESINVQSKFMINSVLNIAAKENTFFWDIPFEDYHTEAFSSYERELFQKHHDFLCHQAENIKLMIDQEGLEPHIRGLLELDIRFCSMIELINHVASFSIPPNYLAFDEVVNGYQEYYGASILKCDFKNYEQASLIAPFRGNIELPSVYR